MIKQKLTILFTGVMCISSLSSFSAVLCYRSDGRAAVEPVYHNQCVCPETEEENSAQTATYESVSHQHCDDILLHSGLLFSSKNIRLLSEIQLAANLEPATFSMLSLFSSNITCCQNDILSAFYTPLRTIVLLV